LKVGQTGRKKRRKKLKERNKPTFNLRSFNTSYPTKFISLATNIVCHFVFVFQQDQPCCLSFPMLVPVPSCERRNVCMCVESNTYVDAEEVTAKAMPEVQVM
jgi:hypothetical protein